MRTSSWTHHTNANTFNPITALQLPKKLNEQHNHVWKYKVLYTHYKTHTHTVYLNSLRAHLKMVISLIARAVDLCIHISEEPSCLSVFLPPGVEQCKFISAVAPNSLALNILSLSYSLQQSHYNLLQHVRGAVTSSAGRYQLCSTETAWKTVSFRTMCDALRQNVFDFIKGVLCGQNLNL